MPGHKIWEERTAMLDEIGVEGVFRMYLEAGTVRELVQQLWTPRNEGETVGVTAFYEWLNRDPARKDAWRSLRKIRGEMDADQAVDIALRATQENWQAAKLQTETLKWRAGVLNREDYGSGVEAAANTIGQAILAAIQKAEEREKLESVDAEYLIEEHTGGE